MMIVVLFLPCFAYSAYHTWIEFGTGNANFFFPVSLVICFVQATLISGAINAILRKDYCISRRIQTNFVQFFEGEEKNEQLKKQE